MNSQVWTRTAEAFPRANQAAPLNSPSGNSVSRGGMRDRILDIIDPAAGGLRISSACLPEAISLNIVSKTIRSNHENERRHEDWQRKRDRSRRSGSASS